QPGELVAVLGKQRFRHWGEVTCLAFARQGKSSFLLGGGSDGVRVWNAATGKEIAALGEESGVVKALVPAPDGKKVAVWSGNQVSLWNDGKREEIGSPKVPFGQILAVGFAAVATKPRLVVATQGDGQPIQVWDLLRKVPLPTPAESAIPVQAAAFSPDALTLAVAGTHKVVRRGEGASGKAGPPVASTKEVKFLVFSRDGRVLATVGQESISLWSVASGAKLRDLSPSPGSVRSVAFSPDGKLLAAGGQPGGVSLWETESGKQVAAIPNLPG